MILFYFSIWILQRKKNSFQPFDWIQIDIFKLISRIIIQVKVIDWIDVWKKFSIIPSWSSSWNAFQIILCLVLFGIFKNNIFETIWSTQYFESCSKSSNKHSNKVQLIRKISITLCQWALCIMCDQNSFCFIICWSKGTNSWNNTVLNIMRSTVTMNI